MGKPRKHSLSVKSQTQKAIYYIILFIGNVHDRKIYDTENRLVVARGWGKGRMGSDYN